MSSVRSESEMKIIAVRNNLALNAKVVFMYANMQFVVTLSVQFSISVHCSKVCEAKHDFHIFIVQLLKK